MMATAPVLRLTRAQVGQLIGYCAVYRSYLWQCTLPSSGRNQTIRRVQLLQGKLEKAQEQAQAEHALMLTDEEKQTLKHLLDEVLRLAANTPHSEQRTRQVAEIAGLRMLVEQMTRQTHAR